MPELRNVHVRISGRVQGVSFRAFVERRANELGLSGWVRNLANGDVEAVFSGPEDAVEAVLAACRQGPRHAEVEGVKVVDHEGPAAGAFTIRPDN